MKITEKEKYFLACVYNDVIQDGDHGLVRYELKRLDNYFISHLTKKKVRMTWNLVCNLYTLLGQSVVGDMMMNGDITDQEFSNLENKFKNFLHIN